MRQNIAHAGISTKELSRVSFSRQTLDTFALPYDLLQAGRQLTFTLGHLFPNLSAPVVAALGRSEFDALFRAQQQHHPGKLGDNATKDFILRYVSK